MWVYFNVPERRYLEYMADPNNKTDLQIELVLANGKKFNQVGTIGAIEADFNNETGNIKFRADFPNPDRLLRHGETGNIRMKKLVKDALLVPQKSTFEILDHHYVFVVGKDEIIKQERIHVVEEVEDLFIISSGVSVDDRIIFEGMRQARDGDKAGEYNFEKPESAFKDLKLKAE